MSTITQPTVAAREYRAARERDAPAGRSRPPSSWPRAWSRSIPIGRRRRTWTAATNPSAPTTARITCRASRRTGRRRFSSSAADPDTWSICLVQSGYRNVLGIDSDAAKVEHALRRRLPCEVAEVFPFLSQHQTGEYDCIIPEQELNHLTMDETIAFLGLCRQALRPGGRVIVYAMNGANPLVGSENLAHNIDHFYNLTEYSIGQVLGLAGFRARRALRAQAVCVLEKSVQLRRARRHRRARSRACGSSSGCTARRCASCRRRSRPSPSARPAASAPSR